MASLTGTATSEGASSRPGVAVAVVLATLVFLAMHAASGLPSLADAGADNDSSLRLVEIRDLLAGQGWFDLRQTRLGLDGGIVMHWSRLVDAPIAALILLANTVTGNQASGETAALIAWPVGLFATCLALIGSVATRRFGVLALLPATVIGGAALHYTGLFAPGGIDHHNLQLTLVLAGLCCLAKAGQAHAARWGALAGVAMALCLAVAMEGAPFVAAAGLVVALLWLFDPVRFRSLAIGFGTGFGATATLLLAATVPPSSWSGIQCDAYSLPQVSLAALGGLGLAAIASFRATEASRNVRCAALACLGALIAGVAWLAFPACLGDPYAQLDPRLRDWWLNAVGEAQPVWSMLRRDPATAAGQYAMPLIGLVAAMVHLRRDRSPGAWASAGLLAVAFAVSLWQVRGAMFSVPLAAIPLAGLVAGRRLIAVASPSPRHSAVMALAWLVSFSVVWTAGAGLLAAPLPSGTPAPQAPVSSCTSADALAGLAALPPARVLAISNMGSAILRYTHHQVLAGPYHRNVAGNLAVLDVLTAKPADARAAMQRSGATLLVLCRSNGESRFIADKAPGGLLAALMRGETPDWLAPVQTGLTPLEVYAVHFPATQ